MSTYGCALGSELTYFSAALPRPLLGMNSAMMKDYVEYVADILLASLGYRAVYGKLNPVSKQRPSFHCT